jgi:hypothetical protein
MWPEMMRKGWWDLWDARENCFFLPLGDVVLKITRQDNWNVRRVRRGGHTRVILVAELLISESSSKGIIYTLLAKAVDGVDIRNRPLFWSHKRATVIHGILIGLSEWSLIIVWNPMSSTLGAIGQH